MGGASGRLEEHMHTCKHREREGEREKEREGTES